MTSLSFKAVLHEVAYAVGLEPEVTFPANIAAALGLYIQKRCRQGWRSFDWPELVRTEQRQFRLSWSSLVTYAAGAEVYDATTDSYFSAVQGSNLNHAVTDTAWWTPAVNLDRYISLEQAGQTVIGDPLGAFVRNPATDSNPVPIQFFRSANGVQFYTNAPSRPWVKFRLPAPRFSTVVWVAGSYSAGTVRYVETDGNCYVALVTTSSDPVAGTGDWAVQTVPEFLKDFVVAGAVADSLSEDGQTDKAAAKESEAAELLSEEQDQLTVQQSQTRRYRVRTCGTR